MLLSMLDTTKVEASTESVTPGALPGENLASLYCFYFLLFHSLKDIPFLLHHIHFPHSN